MNLFSLFSEKSPNKVFISICIGALSGIAYAMLIPMLISNIESGKGGVEYAVSAANTYFGFDIVNIKIAVVFLFSCIFIIFARTISQVLLMQVGMDVSANLRIRLYKKILNAPISNLEKVGPSRIIASISGDIGAITGGAQTLPSLVVSGTTLFSLLLTLLIVNQVIFWLVLKTIVFGVITFQIPMIFSSKYLKQSRNRFDTLHESIRGLIYGAKELKINKEKRASYLTDDLIKNEQAVLQTSKKGQTIMVAAESYGDMICFFVIGFVAFVFTGYQTISQGELITAIMILLYITTPTSEILNAIPVIMRAKICMDKVNYLFSQFSSEDLNEKVEDIPHWNEIRFNDVTYQHSKEDQADSFKIGPINFSILRNQITFIVGGNGSGKTTLSKLISLHYNATSGSIYFGDTQVNANTMNSCRNEIAVIYSDYYLFNRLLDDSWKGNEEVIQRYLVELELDKKVTIKEGYFSTISLSDGQRKRLALLVTFLEEKQLYVFDEWAADQDPLFKKTFYYHILPELKVRGKTVLAISHDDRYFDIADQLLHMENGQLQTKSNISPEPLKVANVNSVDYV